MNAPRPITTDDDALDMGTLSHSLGLLVRLAQVRMYDLFFAAFEGTDVRPGEISMLWMLDLNPGVRQGAVARALQIKPAHMTKLVQQLVSAGHITRRIPPEDRRSVRLSLTDPGRQRLEDLKPTFLALHSAESADLTPQDAAQLRLLLHKLAFPKDQP
ncbi:MarR family transcriptional regulator [Pararhodobacter sp.]|uniref:MarR family winged helix-turn-helix transcriptional regulator n=1 Tax=Pararhodobacter sp. TaxID=2127056 RepID=UPI002AFF1B08|nr:MarR family transcriptional regulator [Pararhodobacter sp.]